MADPRSLITVGWRELVSLPELGLAGIPAKIDTGARTSSLHADVLDDFMRGGERFVRRDLTATPWWLRVPAWWLARREARALQQLGDMPATPRLLRWDGRWLDRSFMAGDAMYQRPPHGDLPYFRAARRLLQQLFQGGDGVDDVADGQHRVGDADWNARKRQNPH